MLTFENKPTLKSEIAAQLKAHYEADEIVKGQYWENGKGCAVGCILHSGNHEEFEDRFGIPEEIAHLADAIHEGLPNAESKEWPVQLWDAVPEGKDLSLVWPKFARWLLVDPEHGVIRFDDDQNIQDVADLFQKQINGETVNQETWDTARAAAGDAVEATGAAAGAAAWDAARAAAGDTAWAAGAAGAAAREARAAGAAGAAARENASRAQREKLLQLLNNTGES